VPKQTPPYLRVHREEPPESPASVAVRGGKVSDACARFSETTGWTLRIAADRDPVDERDVVWSATIAPGAGAEAMRLELASGDDNGAATRIETSMAIALADTTGELIAELARTRHALWQREAELAAGVPVAPHHDEQAHLAERLESILRAGAEAVGYEAAALYMLDSATTELKMRSCWGMPKTKLLDHPRDLPAAVADLEALCGNAVVLDDTASLPLWNVPEEYASAVCVPVSSATNLLGTIWMFGNEKRELSDDETNIVEIVAGRLASELEREVMLSEAVGSVGLRQQVESAITWQADQLPQVQPLADGWDVAGWAEHEHALNTSFYDWFVPREDRICCTLGQVAGDDFAAAMTSSALQTSLRAHGGYDHGAVAQLELAHQTVWSTSVAPRRASLLLAHFEPECRYVDLAATSDICVLLVRRDGTWQSLLGDQSRLGEITLSDDDLELSLLTDTPTLKPGERLLVANRDVLMAEDADGRPWGLAGLAECAVLAGDSPSVFLANIVRSQLERHCGGPPTGNLAILTAMCLTV
jgi:sigma-B regulation protein RsbU (phosphoserine phosphatase)